MSEKAENNSGSLDLVKWAAVVAIVVAAVYANSYFAAESLLARTIGLLVVAGVGGWIAAQTVKGRAFVNLCLEARVEIRKVVWPTRKETIQMTLIVFVLVVIMAIFLAFIDIGFSYIINLLLGRGK